MRELCTIGYEGASLSDFIATLKSAGVHHVIDVRELPQSRRAGFSKNGLASALNDAGLAYSHFKQLGDPKPGREAARKGDFVAFRRIFSEHIKSPNAREALALVGPIVSGSKVALMCFERNPKECHRTIVAAELQAMYDICVRHLGVIEGAGKRREIIAEAA